jgi:tryptophan synthase
MGTTGSSAQVSMNSALPDIISGIREFATVPLAVGFGVATRQHFDIAADAGADGVVIGSRLVSIIKHSSKDEVAKNVEKFCQEISLKGQPIPVRSSRPQQTISAGNVESQLTNDTSIVLPHRFGQFGGQYVPEALFDCLVELEEAHKQAINDPSFWEEFESHFGYMNRPSNLYYAEKLTQKAGGAKIWLKREDL